ncbi:MAG: hypothetical protein IPK10_18565 [Bacteroidetes bacterium]|nr:hypothetical protein [Bacteroidota bacterium]
MPDCHFGDTLPDVVLNANSYCNDPLSSTYDFNNTLRRDTTTSACHDCFTLTKSILEDSIHVGDTVHFVITLTANNGFQQAVYLTDIIPPGFDTIGTYDSLWITPLIGSITDTIVGVFTRQEVVQT